MAYETVETGSFPCPCGAGRVVWEKTEHDWYPSSGHGSPRLDCGACECVIWHGRLSAQPFYVTTAERDELEQLDHRRTELSQRAANMAEERYGAQWAGMLRDADKTRGAKRDLLRKAKALRGSESTISRYLRHRVEFIAADSIRGRTLDVLAVLQVDDPEVRGLLDEAAAADLTFRERQQAVCTRPVPSP